MTRPEFSNILAYLTAAVGKPMSTEQGAAWYDLLGDLPAEVLKAAVRRALLESQYPTIPAVGTIRALAVEVSHGEALAWADAWTQTLKAVGRFGLAKQEEGLASLPDAARQAAEAITWRSLCDANHGDLGTLRAQFRDAYNVTAQREERLRLLPPKLAENLRRLVGQIGMPPAPPEGEGRLGLSDRGAP